jgi:hypothetical protein
MSEHVTNTGSSPVLNCCPITFTLSMVGTAMSIQIQAAKVQTKTALRQY